MFSRLIPTIQQVFDLIKTGVNTLVQNNANDFKDIRLIHVK